MIIPVAALAANSALLAATSARGRGAVASEPDQMAAPSDGKSSTGPKRTSHREVMTLAALDALVSAPLPPQPAYLPSGLPLAVDLSRWLVTGEKTRAKLAALLAEETDTSLEIEVHFEAVGPRLKLVRSITRL